MSRFKGVPLSPSHYGRSDALGLQLLAKGDNPVADIVAIHGLNGHWKATWTAPNGIFWLQDLLPDDIPNARIFSYGYDASISHGQVVSEHTIFDQAQGLIDALAHMREQSQTRQRPIVFVAHSYGGIMLKAALLHSNALAATLPEHHLIKLYTYGVIFLGTPHQGTARASLATIAENLSRGLSPKPTPLATPLQQKFGWLQSLSSKYLLISEDYDTKCYYETRPVQGPQQLVTRKSWTGIGPIDVSQIVPREHAVLPSTPASAECATDTDHFHMGQFSTITDETYLHVRRDFQRMIVARNFAATNSDVKESKGGFFMQIYDCQTDAATLFNEEFGARNSTNEVQVITTPRYATRRIPSFLRQFGKPDILTVIRQEVISFLKPSSNEYYSATFSVYWEAQEYINEELDPDQAWGPVLTVSGDAKNAYATSCAEYMRRTWPNTGRAMLEIIQKAVRVGACYNKWTPELTGSMELHAQVRSETPNTITVQALGSRDALVEMAQQLAWLAASFRVSKSDELTYSDISFRTVGYAQFELKIDILEPLNEAERMCWHPLFPNSVIARGFPIPERTAELGLELPFELMLRLARIDHVMLHDSAIVLSGFSTILFPTALHTMQSQATQKRNTIQWHFLSSGNDHLRILSGETLAKHDNSWLKIGDPEVVRTARTFLGYCNAVCVHLGTERSGYESITHSSLRKEKSPGELSIRSANVGTSGLGIFGGNLTMDVILPKSLSKVTKVDNYDDILSTAKIEPLLLYDAQKQQGWLVSMLSVILHMAHAWVSEHVPNVQLPHAELDWDGGQAAYNVLAKHSRLELRKSLEDETSYCLKDLVKRLWYDLIGCVDAMSLQTRRTRGSIRMGSPRLRGWEFRDVLDPPLLRHMKEEKLEYDGCGWDPLAEDVLVLVCQGLGDVTRPAEPGKVCSKWSPIPKEMRYLTASVTCLQHLSKRRGMTQDCTKITDTLSWQPPGDHLFQNCAHDGINQCSKLPQQLVKDGKMDPASPPEVPEKGAVIFGKHINKLRKRTERKRGRIC